MIKKYWLVLIFGASLHGYSIDFQNALTKTIQNNKSLQAKQKDIQKAKLDLQEAKGYSYGELILSENISRTNHPGYVFGMKMASGEATFGDFGFDQFLDWQMSGMPGGANRVLNIEPNKLNDPESRTNFETKATYKVPLFTGYKLDNGKKMAKLQVMAKTALYNFDEKKLTLEVLKAYNGAVAAKEFIKATQKAKKATNSYVHFASELFNEGLVTNIDVKQAQVYDMGVESNMIEAQNRYDLALSYLKFLTADSSISDINNFYIIQTKSTPLKVLQQKGLNNREDIQWMQLNTKTLQSKVDFESSVKYPTIGAQLEYGFNDNSFNINSDHDYYMAALGISYTLFDGGTSSSKIQKAKIEHKQALDYFEYMQDGIKLEIEKNYLTVEAKQKIYTQKQKARALAQEVLEQSKQMYQNQLINMSELLTQQANEQKANAEAIMAKYELNLAQAILKISLGEEL